MMFLFCLLSGEHQYCSNEHLLFLQAKTNLVPILASSVFVLFQRTTVYSVSTSILIAVHSFVNITSSAESEPFLFRYSAYTLGGFAGLEFAGRGTWLREASRNTKGLEKLFYNLSYTL